MSDNLAPKFAQLSVRSEKVGEDDSSSTFTRANGEEEKGKNNPWKLSKSVFVLTKWCSSFCRE